MTDTKNNSAVNSSEANCTCKQCIGGWFSQRMKDRLEAEADFLQFAALDLAADLEAGHIDDVLPDGLLTEQYISSDTSLHYIPTSLYEHMTPAFLHGYIIVIQEILRILLEDFTTGEVCVPTVATVSARLDEIVKGTVTAWKQQSQNAEVVNDKGGDETHGEDKDPEVSDATKRADIAVLQAYLTAGGKVTYALDAITDSAYEKSPIGGQYRRHLHVREEEADFAKELGDDVPECENDLAFKLVRRMLGLDESEAGPHWIFLSDDEGEEDGEEAEAVYEGTKREGDS
ncbi:hypothetical protein BXZ70DRAFT_908345 [Cristinia sonorae]|uniref:Uncharacterized protein n=1 Tax=Cristinia sonorae TaxID=1940300 RepID=A0A8K0UMH9_9AGAR|nr:hypothetical protein BXZ70DRAFT_908345 [Cristinia sonorae]